MGEIHWVRMINSESVATDVRTPSRGSRSGRLAIFFPPSVPPGCRQGSITECYVRAHAAPHSITHFVPVHICVIIVVLLVHRPCSACSPPQGKSRDREKKRTRICCVPVISGNEFILWHAHAGVLRSAGGVNCRLSHLLFLRNGTKTITLFRPRRRKRSPMVEMVLSDNEGR